jgi:uncharacterized protein YbjT (DUF2867 family)
VNLVLTPFRREPWHSVTREWNGVGVILVIGGRSKIGSALIESLRARGEEVRALVRGQESGRALPAGVEPVVGDLAAPDSLHAAMSGAEKVFLLSSPHRDAVGWHRNAIDAALASGVDLVVRSSIIGADRDSPAEFVGAHTECDRFLEQSGLDYVILRPNLFLQNIPESTMPSIDDHGNFYLDAGDARISMVDTRDVAAVASVVLNDSGHSGAHYDVTGPEALSYHDVASKLSSALGREITYIDAPDKAVRGALLGFGLDEWFADALVGLFQDYRRSGTDGYASVVTDTVERVTGRPPRSLDALLSEFDQTVAVPP